MPEPFWPRMATDSPRSAKVTPRARRRGGAGDARLPRLRSLRKNSLRSSATSTASASGGTGDSSFTVLHSLRTTGTQDRPKQAPRQAGLGNRCPRRERASAPSVAPSPKRPSTENRTAHRPRSGSQEAESAATIPACGGALSPKAASGAALRVAVGGRSAATARGFRVVTRARSRVARTATLRGLRRDDAAPPRAMEPHLSRAGEVGLFCVGPTRGDGRMARKEGP